jgi:predicted nucleic acid-binding protein
VVDIATAIREHTWIGLDTPIFIYQFEQVPPFHTPSDLVLQQFRARLVSGVTSVITLTELLVAPLRANRRGLAARYETIIRSTPNLFVRDVDGKIARRAAALRAGYSLRTADAIQVATAIEQGATAFVTNDHRLRRIAELRIIVLSDYPP